MTQLGMFKQEVNSCGYSKSTLALAFGTLVMFRELKLLEELVQICDTFAAAFLQILSTKDI